MHSFRIFEGENLAEGAKIALERTLYVKHKNFCMKRWYENIISGYYYHFKRIVVCFDGNVPIAVGMIPHHEYSRLGIYVERKYRRQGIGTAILKMLTENGNFTWAKGIKGSVDFYSNFEVEMKQKSYQKSGRNLIEV